MNSGYWFLLILFILPMSLLIYHVGNPIKYFKTDGGKDAAKGIIIVMSVLTLIILLGGCASQGNWGTEVHAFGGIDYTKNVSPQCEAGGANDKGTSNVGLWGTIWETLDRRTKVKGKYTHHSCFVNEDRESYDALGLELSRELWSRK